MGGGRNGGGGEGGEVGGGELLVSGYQKLLPHNSVSAPRCSVWLRAVRE